MYISAALALCRRASRSICLRGENIIYNAQIGKSTRRGWKKNLREKKREDSRQAFYWAKIRANLHGASSNHIYYFSNKKKRKKEKRTFTQRRSFYLQELSLPFPCDLHAREENYKRVFTLTFFSLLYTVIK